MRDNLEVVFAPLSVTPEPTCVAFAAEDLDFGTTLQTFDSRSDGAVLNSSEAADFTGKTKTTFEILAPAKLELRRLIIVGIGKPHKLTQHNWTVLGGFSLGHITSRKTDTASLIAQPPDCGELSFEQIAASLAFGALLRNYAFEKYQTDKAIKNNDEVAQNTARPVSLKRLVVHCVDPQKARAAFAPLKALANGVYVARDLVNEPANILGTIEFSERAKELKRLGVKIETLDESALSALKMGSLLSVGKGSSQPTRVVIMQWFGAKSKHEKPLAFVGKGVVFDSGGISIKAADGMENMKGDMGGAACVTGLMHALAQRKADVNVVGLIGLAENMTSGSATRPGDIVTSMSGQTIEVINTDAEGRMILADLLWYARERFKPKLVVDLATLTGSIIVALGTNCAGVFANDDKLANDLMEASKATGERIWRMPLEDEYDKLIDSKTADMKNFAGRQGGACVAAAFLKRFVNDTAWAHIDLAGPAMGASENEINTSWGSGWGVCLLNAFVADNFETAEK